ncbi:acetyl-CoA carboxylase, carboxyltransferase subunit beta [bacterium]|nr:acetyl-CoA carboxylase, carboxyltransferase subunit beta [bacterium]MBU1599612.1 acetyl-CoA carboxylase, carboxyltransferase subunit beta [bacterium]
MSWFKKPKYTTLTIKPQIEKRPSPDGIWIKCEECNELIYKKEWLKLLKICPKCGFHFQINPEERVKIIFDKGSFKESFSEIQPVDFLGFKDIKGYKERLLEYQKKVGLSDAIVCGKGKIGGITVASCLFDFSFMGGSMGSVVGEKVTLTAELAQAERIPLLIFSASGGARMQEGIISLLQMAKTVSAINSLKKEGGFYLSVLCNPTTGGVAASFAFLGDVVIAEPKALIGFAGPRVIEQTIKEKLPAGFQRAEFLSEHGMVDMIVKRKDLKKKITELLRFFVTV